MKLLITGFEPFGGSSINAAWSAVDSLPERIGAWELHKLQLPTVFGTAAQRVLAAAEELRPDAVLCVGQAGGRGGVTPEMAALNLRFARIPDNAGQSPMDEPVIPGGPAAYFATLPARVMTNAIQAAGLPAAVSYSAGVFVCNDLFYSLLHHFRDTPTRVGFIHVPFLPQQGEPSLPLKDTSAALVTAILALDMRAG